MRTGSSPVPDAASSTKSTKSSKSDKSDEFALVGHIEADADETYEYDSAVGEGFESSTHSISSSIVRYREENGRTYHAYKDGKYVMPNDELEQERLDLQHHLFLITFDDRLYLSPAGKHGHQMHHVLDVGTGTGLWALDFADEHPEAKVIGVDLSPIQTDLVPTNLHYQVDDLEDTWEFGDNFDFIYSRMMTASFANWPRFFKQAYDNLNPGGWLELADICPVTSDDGTLEDDMPMAKWVTQLLDGTRMIGRPFDGAMKYKEQMEAQGFQNVTQLVYKWPQNRWPKNRRLKELGMAAILSFPLLVGLSCWPIVFFYGAWTRELTF